MLWGAAIVLLVFLAYWPALGNGFIWDDDFHVQANDTLRSIDGLRRIWVEPRSIPQYYPLVHTTFWIEYHLWNLSATGYHVVNVLLHAATAILFWRLLVRLAVPGAWLAAAIFAVHPVEVESVAWITERKNVLSAALALASMLAYLRFNPAEAVERRPADDVPREWGWYTLALALFVAAILAKTVTVAVPALLMVIYWWKRGVVSPRDVGTVRPVCRAGAGDGTDHRDSGKKPRRRCWPGMELRTGRTRARRGARAVVLRRQGPLAERFELLLPTLVDRSRRRLAVYISPRRHRCDHCALVGAKAHWPGAAGGGADLYRRVVTGARILRRLPVPLFVCRRPFSVSREYGVDRD